MKRLRVVLGLALGTVALASFPEGARAAPTWNFDWAGAVEVAAEGLSSDLPKTRLEAVTQLLAHDISLTKAYLLRAVTDSDILVRHAAAKGLGAGAAVEAVQLMMDWLADPDAKTKIVAADALGDIGGPDATAALTRSLGDADPGVRQHAVRSLGAIGKRGNPGVVIAMIPRLEDEKSEVKRETIEQLEGLGDKRAVIPLVARFADGTPVIVTAAIRAIGKLGDRSAVPALIRLMNDPREEIKTAAVHALGLVGAVDALDALTAQLNVGSEPYRTKVAYALGQIAATPNAGKAGEDAMRTLVGNLAIPKTRGGAREGLVVAGKAAVPALVLHLQGRIPGDPTTAVELLAAVADPRATAVLASELERGRVAMPIVLRALGATKDPAALVPMLGALANKDPEIRLAAMDSLRPLIGRDARAGDVLIEQLGDQDLEIRVLAAEYLGMLGTPAAAPKLIALASPGNPTRLRLAAIDALGMIGTPAATKPLLEVLREGPSELHRAAATALAYAADPTSIPGLIALAKSDHGASRHEIVRALGATARSHPDATGRAALRELARDSNVKVSLAAIAGLAAAGDKSDGPFLRTLAEQAASDRQRAAVWALGELRDPAAIDVLFGAMTPRTDRVLSDRLVGDAAWALGEILSATPKDARVSTAIDRWLHASKFGGWAAAIDGAGALARLLWATPASERSRTLGARRAAVIALAYHKSRLVRLNAAVALGSLDGDDAIKPLVHLLQTDSSQHVRGAAATALARATANPLAKKALETAAAGEADAQVKAAAKVALVGPTPMPARSEWRNFYVVDADADDAPVRQEPYFVHDAGGIVWASYTDARGELTSEHVTPGTERANVQPASRESEY